MARRGSYCAMLAMAILLFGATVPAVAEPWLQFRGNAAKTGVVTDASSPRDQGWVFEAVSQTQFVASAVLDGAQVVAADYTGAVYALDVDDGSLRWSYSTGDIVTATPAISGSLVFVPSGKRLVCLEVQPGGTSVTQKWVFTSTGRIDSSPTVAGSAVFVGSDDRNLYKLDLLNGSLIWNFSASDVVKASPSVVGAAVYFGSYDGFLYALEDAGSSATLSWRYDAQGEIAASAAVSGGRVFLATLNGRVIALNTADGARVWEASLGGVIASSPAVSGSHLFVGGDTLSALDLSTGNTEWTRPLTGYVRASPAVVSGEVLVGDYGGRVFAFRSNGSIAWSYDTGSAIRTSPAAGQGLAFVGNDEGQLVAVPLAAGDPPAVQAMVARKTFEGVTETFAAVANDPEGKDLFYAWDFGDGAQATGQSVRHRYGAAGNYTITVTVSDGLQSKSVTTVVTVERFSSSVSGGTPPPGPGSGLSTMLLVAGIAVIALLVAIFVFRLRRSRGTSVEDVAAAPRSRVPVPTSAKGPAKAPPRAPTPPAAPLPAHRQEDEIDYYARLYGSPPPATPAKGPARPPRPPSP